MSLKKLSAEFEKHMPKPIVRVASNMMSAPARMRSNRKIKRDTRDVKLIKEARMYEGMPDFDMEGNFTEGFKARSLANEVKERLLANRVPKKPIKISLPRMRVGRRLP